MSTAISSFYSVLTVILGGIAGALISTPFVFNGKAPSFLGTTLLIVAAFLGAAAGYRRRESRAFFYLTVITVLVLATTISSSIRQ